MNDVSKSRPEPLDLDAIEARANAATPGPWWPFNGVSSDGTDYPGGIEASNEDYLLLFRSVANRDRDLCFVAAAREDVPALIAEVRALRAMRDRVERYLDVDYAYRHGDMACTAKCVPMVLREVRAAIAGDAKP